MNSFSGNAIPIESILNISESNGFVFNSFDNLSNYFISQLKKVHIRDFEFYYSNDIPYIIDKRNYLKSCNHLIDLLNNNQFKKIIYSRVHQVSYTENPVDIFQKLNQLSTNTFNYLISIKGIGTWLGATPEELVKLNDSQLQTTSIAGTKKSKSDQWTEKELEEQQIVTDFIRGVLTTNNCKDIAQTGPFDLNTGVVYHLRTDFSALTSANEWKNIVMDLHPTPATCGLPQQETLQYIKDFESHQRHYYTGFLGPVNENSANLYVNLRCMSLSEKDAYLYLGGGITKDSNAEDEWHETENKAQTLLRLFS